MLRIRGTIGTWPVDLTVELDDEDWARLACVQAIVPEEARPAPARSQPVDAIWQSAQDLLRTAGQMEGPDLLAQLQALAGSADAGKRLLVRLRHCPQVKLESGADTPLYRWQT